MTFEEEKIRRLTLNLPDETYKRLGFLAKYSNRSMTKLINHVIDEQFTSLFGKGTTVADVIRKPNQFPR